LPADLATATGRLARLQSALAQIEAQDLAARAPAAHSAAKASHAAEAGRKLSGRKPKDPHAALARAETEHTAALTAAEAKLAARNEKQAVAAAAGRKLKGRPPGPDGNVEAAAAALSAARTAAAAAPPKPYHANTTDPDSRIMKTANGWIQGYNAQAAVNDQQIVVACSVTQEGNDVHQYQPMAAATATTLTAARVTGAIGLLLADAGYWSEDNANAPGPERLIATLKDWKQRRAARELGTTTGLPPEHASPLEVMEHRLRTPDGAQAYAQRSHTVEPVFGNLKENRGWRRFRRRGLAAANSEWALMTLSHNLSKLFDARTNPEPA